jgi:hypothetical protein
MSETNETQVANEAAGGEGERPTMEIGEAAKLLGLTVPQVRRLCKIWEASPGEGLDFAWSTPWAPRTDRNGHLLRGHRLPYVDAVQKMRAAQRVAGR